MKNEKYDKNKLLLSCAKLSTTYACYSLAGSQLAWRQLRVGSQLAKSLEPAIHWLGDSYQVAALWLATTYELASHRLGGSQLLNRSQLDTSWQLAIHQLSYNQHLSCFRGVGGEGWLEELRLRPLSPAGAGTWAELANKHLRIKNNFLIMLAH